MSGEVLGRRQMLTGEVLAAVRRRPSLALGLVGGGLLQATGHGLLAGAAGVLARSLAGGTTRALGSMVGGIDVRRPDATVVLEIAVVGLLAAVGKLVGGAVAAKSEAEIAGDVATTVRLAVLDDVLAKGRGRDGDCAVPPVHRLHAPGQGDQGERTSAHAQLAALTSHIHDVERGVAGGVLAEVRNALLLFPLALLLVVLAPRLAGSAVLALGGFGVFAFVARRAFKRANQRAAQSTAALVAAADEAVKHAELWATYGAKNRIRAHVAKASRAIAREASDQRVRTSVLSSTSEVLGALALVLVLLLVARDPTALGVDRGAVVPFAIAFFMAYRPLRDLVEARLARSRGDAALELVRADAPRNSGDPSISDATAEAASFEPWALEKLRLEGVRVGHGTFAPLSFDVPPGAIVAVVGPTGIGKTSLFRALLGLEPLAAGRVRYGKKRIDLAGVGPHARPFAWVPQDAPVVADTLAVNVGLGQADDAPGAGARDARAVLADLGATGLATAIDPGAILATERTVSGGERQWIATARALASGLPVLLLDEPTSALDGASQARFLEALVRLKEARNRSVIVVTHRPEPLAVADVVVRLEPVAAPDLKTSARSPAIARTS